MIEDKLARHYQADALPEGHPVREAIEELRRLRAERDALRACGYESIAMYRRCRDERDALLELVGDLDAYEGAEGWSDRTRERINAALAKGAK